MQFLVVNGISKNTIANYLSAVKYYFTMYDLDVAVFAHPKIHLFLRSLTINRSLNCKMQGIIDMALLRDIVQATIISPHSIVYRAIFLTAYFSFLRISNFAPEKAQSFDPSRHLSRGDVIFAPPGAHLIIKWAKNNQNRDHVHVVQIPALSYVQLCPVTALRHIINLYGAG